MRKLKFISIILSLMILFTCMGVVLAQAETVPVETQPVVTDPVSSEVYTDPTSDVVTDPTDYTEPTGTEYTDPSEPETQRPTEYDEPSTYSDYVSPDPIYTPGDQDYDSNEWENLALDLSSGGSDGPGSFEKIKSDRSNKDRTNPLWIILCGICWCLSLSAITLAILYKPQGAKRKAKATAASSRSRSTSSSSRSKSSRTPSPRYERKYSDDYNDGY